MATKQSTKGLELALGFQDEWAGFGWSSNATFTLNRNKIVRLASGSINPVTGEEIQMDNMPVGWLGKENVAPRVILTEGGSMTDIYVYNQLTRDNNGNIKVDQVQKQGLEPISRQSNPLTTIWELVEYLNSKV